MKTTAYRRVDRLAADSAPSGAVTPVNIQWDQNHVGNWYIEEQRYGTDAIVGGIAHQDSAAIERGLKMEASHGITTRARLPTETPMISFLKL